MQKTKIEWCDYSWNPVKGLCPNACWYCYARAMYKRFKWNPRIRADDKAFCAPSPGKPTRIFVGSTIDLFHPQIPSPWLHKIIWRAGTEPDHTFIFLTKNPARYAEFDFPKNCWLGTTVTRREDMGKICHLGRKENIVFISYEPLLDHIAFPSDWVDWVIVGAMTGPGANKHQPHKEWVEKIVRRAKRDGINIPVFLKNNLKPIWGPDLIQECPKQT